MELFSFKITSFAVYRRLLEIMKSFNNLLVVFASLATFICTDLEAQDEQITDSNTSWQQFGEEFEPNDVQSAQMAKVTYEELEESESVELQLNATVSSVCQVKGCWMVLDLADGEQTRVTFKDYGFFVPTDITGKEVIVRGYASTQEISETDQRHYAKDAGLPAEEIRAIKGAKKAYSLVADGVILKE